MRRKRCLLAAVAIACLAGCAASPPPPPDRERHRCVEIPNGLAECSPREE